MDDNVYTNAYLRSLLEREWSRMEEEELDLLADIQEGTPYEIHRDRLNEIWEARIVLGKDR